MSDKIKKNLPLILLILGGLSIVAGILVMIFGAGGNEGAIKALFVIFAILLMLLGCVVIYLTTILDGSPRPNFFLYDKAVGRNIFVDELTFERVNKRMTTFMAKLASNAREVWAKDVVGSDNELFGEGDVYRPLAAYKAVYDLIDRGSAQMWKSYLDADDDVIVSIADALAMNGDIELGKALRFLHKKAEGDYTKTEKFLSDNKNYLEKKMMSYVKNNIDKF